MVRQSWVVGVCVGVCVLGGRPCLWRHPTSESVNDDQQLQETSGSTI